LSGNHGHLWPLFPRGANKKSDIDILVFPEKIIEERYYNLIEDKVK